MPINRFKYKERLKMKHLEIEMKTSLSEEEYDGLLDQFSEVTLLHKKLLPRFAYLQCHRYAHSY